MTYILFISLHIPTPSRLYGRGPSNFPSKVWVPPLLFIFLFFSSPPPVLLVSPTSACPAAAARAATHLSVRRPPTVHLPSSPPLDSSSQASPYHSPLRTNFAALPTTCHRPSQGASCQIPSLPFDGAAAHSTEVRRGSGSSVLKGGDTDEDVVARWCGMLAEAKQGMEV